MSAKVGLAQHFRKLASFRGREDRASFWPYAALALGIVMIAGSAISLPLMVLSMRKVGESAVAPPEEPGFDMSFDPLSKPVPEGAAAMLSPDLLAVCVAMTAGLAVLLYAAAIVRRLHDRGRSGAWGLMPLPFLAFALVGTVRLLDSMNRGEPPDMALVIALAAADILFWAALLALVVLLAGAAEPGPNRFDLDD